MTETANRVPKLMRNDFTVVLSLSGSAVDEPDTQFYGNYSCRSPRNYTGHCNPEVYRHSIRGETRQSARNWSGGSSAN